jgi:tripartite ATP-independent transporter DctM subunit
MEWWLITLIFISVLVFLMLLRIPVFYCFLAICVVGSFALLHGNTGLLHLIESLTGLSSAYSLVVLPLFVMMGEILFHTDLAYKAISTIDMLLGRIPGRLGVVAVISGTVFAALSGSSIGSAAMLGTVLTPDMEKRGYHKVISLGSVMSAGALAAIIPPSGMAVLIASIAEVSVGKLLIAGIIPGIFLAFLYVSYIIVRCIIQPHIAPRDRPAPTSIVQKVIAVGKNLAPIAVIIVAVLGSIFFGVATTTESAAVGAFAAFLLSALYKKLNWSMFKKVVSGTSRITIMILFIYITALAFSQVMAASGATQGMVKYITGLNLSPILLVTITMIIVLILGCFLDSSAIVMIVIPIVMPILKEVGFNPILFCLLFLINIETGFLTPPFGMVLFVMKGIASKDTSTKDIWLAAIPFFACNVIAIFVILSIPQIAVWLPSMMTY